MVSKLLTTEIPHRLRKVFYLQLLLRRTKCFSSLKKVRDAALTTKGLSYGNAEWADQTKPRQETLAKENVALFRPGKAKDTTLKF